MKHTHLLVVPLLLLTVFSCEGQKDPVVRDRYENCCGTEPTEFTIKTPDAGKDAYIYVPNIFTPNGDGINDFFVPSIAENIRGFDAYLIYTAEGDTLLFDRPGFDFNDIANYAWDGNRRDGTPYVGAFKYDFTVFLAGGGLHRFSGRACRVLCGPDAAVLRDKVGCFYPSQAGADGHLDKAAGNNEKGCFE
jgi:hypothetical protein